MTGILLAHPLAFGSGELKTVTTKNLVLIALCMLGNLNDVLTSADSCQHYLFKIILSRVASEYQTAWIQINPNKLWDLI